MTKGNVYTIDIHCSKCQSKLYRYRKEGGGKLVKCYKDMILEDNTKGDLDCQQCGQEFARDAVIHNRPANKIIQGKVFIRGHVKK